jgi:hypothetical protein
MRCPVSFFDPGANAHRPSPRRIGSQPDLATNTSSRWRDEAHIKRRQTPATP